MSDKPPSLYLPYVQGLSEKIQTVCKKIGVQTVFKTHGTLRQLLMNVKNKRSIMKKKKVVYRIPCPDCDVSYIGETGRSLQKYCQNTSMQSRIMTERMVWQYIHGTWTTDPTRMQNRSIGDRKTLLEGS